MYNAWPPFAFVYPPLLCASLALPEPLQSASIRETRSKGWP